MLGRYSNLHPNHRPCVTCILSLAWLVCPQSESLGDLLIMTPPAHLSQCHLSSFPCGPSLTSLSIWVPWLGLEV